MEVITIDTKAFQELETKLNIIYQYISAIETTKVGSSDKDWVDSYDVCTFLKISERTLQRLRTKGVITYSQMAGKTYYQIVEIRRILNDRLIRCDADRLNDLITGHKEYLAQRRRNKPKSK